MCTYLHVDIINGIHVCKCCLFLPDHARWHTHTTWWTERMNQLYRFNKKNKYNVDTGQIMAHKR